MLGTNTEDQANGYREAGMLSKCHQNWVYIWKLDWKRIFFYTHTAIGRFVLDHAEGSDFLLDYRFHHFCQKANHGTFSFGTQPRDKTTRVMMMMMMMMMMTVIK
ncbi:uncharacterized protein LOC143654848 [Tamandua tetradactyla]|uniref:uncharacterized protein LOC143654848 n=1 Tax=Tamandua tetradactyla TaxID=48850 RepID=UPI0040543737